MRPFITACVVLLAVTLVFAGYSNQQIDKTNTHLLRPQLDNTDEDSLHFFEDFENGLGDWTTMDVTDPGYMWHPDTFNAYSGANSWWCANPAIGGYDNRWLQYLLTPVLDFTTVSAPILTFKLYCAVEDPAGADPPYDGWDGCNVWMSIDGGDWEVINPTAPAYISTCLYSFGSIWGMGEGIAGWAGILGDWLDAEFDLSAAAGASQVQIRFAFCSDGALCSVGTPDIPGFQVDEVSIDDGATNLLYNDADGIATPEEFTFDTGPVSGDYWQLTDVTAGNGDWSAWCDHAGHYSLSDAIVSPWIDIPEDYQAYITFYVWCDLPDWDGDENGYLEDYYQIDVSIDGMVWEQICYDYGDDGRPGAASYGWELYTPDRVFGTSHLTLDDYVGETIKIRWRVTTDDNDDGGVGTGFYIDDVSVWITQTPEYDVGADNLHIPFPTSLSMPSIDCSVDLYNYGRLDQSAVTSFYRADSSIIMPLIPWVAIPSGEFVTKDFTWDISSLEAGPHWMEAYTVNSLDTIPSNDTTNIGFYSPNDSTFIPAYIDVTPAGIYELGYDARGQVFYSYSGMETGEGIMTLFDPADFNLPETIDIIQLKVIFRYTGFVTIHVYDYEEITPTLPGAELSSWEEEIRAGWETRPYWKYINLDHIPELLQRTDPFWVFVEQRDPDQGRVTLDLRSYGAGHYFYYDMNSNYSEEESYNFNMRVQNMLSAGVDDRTSDLTPVDYRLEQNYPNPFNPATAIDFHLKKGGLTTLRVYNILGEMVDELVNGHMDAGAKRITFDASNLSSGIYFYKLESGDFTAIKKMALMK